MARMWTCECRALNTSSAAVCSVCGLDRTPRKAKPARGTVSICPADNSPVKNGVCSRTGEFPMTERCPFACPICRKALEWSGACSSCNGTMTGQRDDWTFPGDRYELEDGHWVKALDGPRRACTRAENQQGARDLVRALAGSPLAARLPAEPMEEEVPF